MTLVDAKAIAKELDVPASWVEAQARSGAMPSVKLGRYRRFDMDEVRAWVESLASGGGPTYRKHVPTTGGRT